jgi:hypothetical protein
VTFRRQEREAPPEPSLWRGDLYPIRAETNLQWFFDNQEWASEAFVQMYVHQHPESVEGDHHDES